MPFCALCESETFDSIDGLYFCQSCGTQSQDIRDEDVDDQYGEPSATLQVSKKGTRGQKKRFYADKGKPWFMYEAYQHVMKAQVEFLIGLGVNQALKDVVFKLWHKYLQITGSAFTSNPDGTLPSKSSIFYYRDAELLGLNKRNKRQKKTIEDDDSDKIELCSYLSDEQVDDPHGTQLEENIIDGGNMNLEDDLPGCHSCLHAKPADKDNHESSDEEFVGSVTVQGAKHGTPINCRSKIRVGHSSLQLTLVFCYLGLLWIDEPIFLSDIIRWAKQGQFPFFQATRHLPGYMKFGFGDFHCLCPKRVPLLRTLLRHASQIAKLLRLPRFPDQKWATYTSRFIVDLHLPGILHGIVRKLLRRARVSAEIYPALFMGGGSCIPLFEIGAMAFIVVAMKLCYGLDDNTERKQEAIAVQSSDANPCNVMPLFTDWLKCWKRCEAKNFENGVPWTDEQSRLLRNPAAYTSFCRSDIFGSWNPTDKVYTGIEAKNYRINRTTNEESQKRYAQLFKSVMSRVSGKEFSGLTSPPATSFTGTCTHVTEESRGPMQTGTCSHMGDSGEGCCFKDLLCRGVNALEHFENGRDAKYVSYPRNSLNQYAFHDSYIMLLNILADRIEVTADDIQVEVRKIEGALFGNTVSRAVFN